LKTIPGRVARFDHVVRWILLHIDNPSGLQISGTLARAYFKPGEVGNPTGLRTTEAVKAWAAVHRIEVWYVERTDAYHFSR
jgi:hypothetical protein